VAPVLKPRGWGSAPLARPAQRAAGHRPTISSTMSPGRRFNRDSGAVPYDKAGGSIPFTRSSSTSMR
jgi:hypothetical protein